MDCIFYAIKSQGAPVKVLLIIVAFIVTADYFEKRYQAKILDATVLNCPAVDNDI